MVNPRYEKGERTADLFKKISQHPASIVILKHHSHPENFSVVKVSLTYSLVLNSILTASK